MLTEYDRPYPKVTDEAEDDEQMCARSAAGQLEGYGCTRTPGHPGRHEAGIFGGLMVASWTEGPADG